VKVPIFRRKDQVAGGEGAWERCSTRNGESRSTTSASGVAIEERMLGQAYAEAKLVERLTGFAGRGAACLQRGLPGGRVPALRVGVTILPARIVGGYGATTNRGGGDAVGRAAVPADLR
jgi:hypothetical protein